MFNFHHRLSPISGTASGRQKRKTKSKETPVDICSSKRSRLYLIPFCADSPQVPCDIKSTLQFSETNYRYKKPFPFVLFPASSARTTAVGRDLGKRKRLSVQMTACFSGFCTTGGAMSIWWFCRRCVE
ncbi:hypothetical protein CEP51_012539 [Fusarium floridanum]|uniref:Uncharacterized protein n=1 Tax=Fusarium floridanum TaxID=1325733 RepID=A0A428QSK8_9HYPO|nr:hypothetical protein CEP51_012539 [Fusarium floridanum]